MNNKLESLQYNLPEHINMEPSPRNNTPNSSDISDIIIDINESISVKIEEEEKLIEYAENHFTNLDNMYHTSNIYSLENIDDFESNFNDKYIRSNSPLTMSHNGSRSGSDDEPDTSSSINRYKQITYNDVDKIIDKYYDLDIENKFSNELDIMTTYIKGQKNLYIQSKYLTQRKLNCLMFPALILSAAITIISPFIDCHTWSVGLTLAINATIALLLSIINYLKLESTCETYLQIANNYDKLETSLDLANNKIDFLENDNEKNALVLNKLREVEKKISEIKESTNILIPDEIKLLFPIICTINIFSFIKKIEIYKKNLMIKFKDVKNEIRYILCKWQKNEQKNGQKNEQNDLSNNLIDKLKEKNRLIFLYEIKEKLKIEIMDYRNAYGSIDEIFTKEIKFADSNKMNWYRCILCMFCKSNKKPNYLGNNPVVDKYFRFIFVDE
jgi:hypothetical protein